MSVGNFPTLATAKLFESRVLLFYRVRVTSVGRTPAMATLRLLRPPVPLMRILIQSRTLSTTRTSFQDASNKSANGSNVGDKIPKPPPPIADSTSALDYKYSHWRRAPPLPEMDLPRSRSAEEAVTNILYNTPPPSLQPFKK